MITLKDTSIVNHDAINNLLINAKTPYTQQSHTVGNILAQIGRIPGGIAQGTIKAISAPGLLKESIDNKVRDKGQASSLQVKNEAVNAFNNGNAYTNFAAKANQGVENRTNSWVAPPETKAAEFAAVAFDAVGEAIPGTAAAVATGGNALVGNALSYGIGSAAAFSSEMLEGSGDVGMALVRAGTAYASEALGGKLFGSLSAGTGIKSLAGGAFGEGLEENIDGVLFSAATGDSYTLPDAVQDFAVGAVAGAALGGAGKAVNAVNASVTPRLVERAINAQITDAANADIAHIGSLIENSSDSTASAIVAEDSLEALQKSVANPINAEIRTSEIPKDIAERFHLVPAGEGIGNPIEITKLSYEGIVNPVVSNMETRSVSLAERATADPNSVDASNPRALYKYAEDIYLRPGTDMNQYFSYRGQGNEFYSSTIEKGVPPSGIGKSWEGSGVYSSPTTYTTDLYGPSGKLSDNPYINSGIDHKTVDVDYPIGIILAQDNNLTEETGRLTRHDAPEDVIPEGTRRIRSDPNGLFVTEMVNNPADVQAVGMIFGRQTIEQSTPIQYANTVTQGTDVASERTDAAITAAGSSSKALVESFASEETGQYTVRPLINSAELTVISNSEGHEENRSNEYTSTAETSPISTDIVGGEANERVKAFTENAIQYAGESIAEAANEPPYNLSYHLSSGYNAIKDSPYSFGRTSNNGLSGNAVEPNELDKKYSESDEKARSIWLPEQAARAANAMQPNPAPDTNNNRRRERDGGSFDFHITRGPGSTGRVYETTGYNATFGGLSSY